MAATGFTPISLYYSSSAAAVPLAANLANGELALNTADMKLYAKNSSGVVTLLASNASTGATVSSVAMSVPAFLSVSGSPITSSGTLAVTLSGTALPVANGGTGQTSYTDGELLIGNTTGNTLTKATLTAGTGVSITNGNGSITINATGTGGTVTSVSVVSANGLAGTVANATTTPAITLSTSITGVLKGNGTAISAAVAGTDYVTPTGTETLTNKTITGTKETRVTMAASDIDLSAGNWFTKTISATTTLTVSNTPASGTAASFILDLTNGGSQTINWWTGVKWVGGTAPTLTTSGRDSLGFYTYDGGTTWTGLVLGKDIK